MQTIQYWFRPVCSDSKYSIDIQGEGLGTSEPPSDAQVIIHFGCPRATRRRLTQA